MAKKTKETTIKDLLDIFLPKIWIMLLVGVLLAGMIGAYSVFFKKDTYTASAEIYVYKHNTSSSATTSDIAAAEEMVNIYERAICGDQFLVKVKESLYKKNPTKWNFSTKEIENKISISKVDNTPNFIIKVTTGSPDLSHELAQSIVVDGIESGALSEIIKNNLDASVFERPKASNEIKANSKNVVRNCIIAFLAGFILSAVCVWIFSSFDVVIRSSKKIEDNLDIPVLGIIPRHDVISTEEVKS